MRRIIAMLLALLTALTLLPPAPVRAAPGGEPIPGVDYDRFTQRAMKGEITTFDAEFHLGELTFRGEFRGTMGLTYDEMYPIIQRQMKEKGLTLEEVTVFSTLGSELQKAWYKNPLVLKEAAKKLAVALSNYIPAPGGDVIVKVGLDQMDINYSESFAQEHHTYLSVQQLVSSSVDVAETVTEAAYKHMRDEIVSGMSKEQAAKALAKAKFPHVPFGWIAVATGTINAMIELWNEDSYNEFCDRMTAILALISDFYSSCSREMNDLAEKKNSKSVGVFFDNAAATYFGKFFGVDNVAVEYRLNGELTRRLEATHDTNLGRYQGALELTIEGMDMAEHFDKVFFNESDLWQTGTLSDWQLILNRMGTASALIPYGERIVYGSNVDVARSPTQLKRVMSGGFLFELASFSPGRLRPVLLGKLNDLSDKTEFQFSHTIEQTGDWDVWTASPEPYFVPENLGKTRVTWFLSRHLPPTQSADPYYLDVQWVGNRAADYYFKGAVGPVMYGEGVSLRLSKEQFGTLYTPLASVPELELIVPAGAYGL